MISMVLSLLTTWGLVGPIRTNAFMSLISLTFISVFVNPGKSLQAVCLLHTLLTHPSLITPSGIGGGAGGRRIIYRAMLIAPVNTLVGPIYSYIYLPKSHTQHTCVCHIVTNFILLFILTRPTGKPSFRNG